MTSVLVIIKHQDRFFPKDILIFLHVIFSTKGAEELTVIDIFFVLLRIAALFTALLIIIKSASYIIRRINKREEHLEENSVEPHLIESALKKYGYNTNSVIFLYGDLTFYNPLKNQNTENLNSLVGYVSLDSENIMIADPLCRPEDTKSVIRDFTQFTQHQDKSCLIFAVGARTARQAAELGFGVIQIGKEPVFDLRTYDPVAHSSKLQSAIRQVHKKGFTIEEVTGEQLHQAPWSQQINEVMKEWFLSRKSEKMQLLSEVSPLKVAAHKKYFVARTGDRIEAFLACSPVFARNGFFIHDLIRRPNTMNGVSEALITQALKAMKEQGYEFASLGIASLAGLDEAGVNSNFPFLNKLLVRVFNKHTALMNFKSLYHFKKKFGPTSEEPAFLAFYPPRFKLGYILAVGSLFSPDGLIGTALYKWRQWRSGNQLPRPLANLLSDEIVTLSRPPLLNFSEFIIRCRFTCFMFFLNIYTYMHTVSRNTGDLQRNFLQEYGFNIADLFNNKWYILVTSNFLHFNYLHLMGNMILLLVFGGVLEFVGGSTLAALVYLISMNANIPTAYILLPLFRAINFYGWHVDIHYLDVGASLGVMGLLGGLFHFLKYRRKLLVFTFFLLMGIAILQNNFIGTDHSLALLIGYTVGHVYFNRGYPRSVFQNLFVPHAVSTQNRSVLPFRRQNR